VDPHVTSHKLSIYKEARYVSQKKRKLGEERRQAAKVEADKLLSVMSSNFCPHLIFKFGDLIEFSVLKD